MPDSGRKARWYLTLGMLVGMTIALVVVTVIARDAQVKVNEQVRATRVAEVAACFAAARGRPRLIIVLRALSAQLADDAVGRGALNDLINDYESSTPLVSDCVGLAETYRLDPAEFPPSTPRGEEGK